MGLLFRQRDGTVEGWNRLEAFGSMVRKWGLKSDGMFKHAFNCFKSRETFEEKATVVK